MTDSAPDANGENPFGLSAAEWKFYQFVRSSPKVYIRKEKKFLNKLYLYIKKTQEQARIFIVGCQIYRSS